MLLVNNFVNGISLRAFYLFICFIVCTNSIAQTKDTSSVPIKISSQGYFHLETDSGGFNRFINNVSFVQGETTIYCDSAHQYTGKNVVECFGDVRIVQPGTQVTGDYARYTSSNKMAYMRGKVNMINNRSTLQTEELTYDVITKIGSYNDGGVLHDSTTTVSSISGIYNANTKDARFKGNVFVDDPQYKVTSRDLGYNTETKLVTYYDTSVTTSDKMILKTWNGTYDSKKGLAHFVERSSVFDNGEYIEANRLDYDRSTGIGEARDSVITIDTTQRITMYCGYAKYNRKKKLMWALIKPVMKQVNGKDTLYIRADTFLSAPIPRPSDTISILKTVIVKTKKGTKTITSRVPVEDTADDSTRKRYFIGYYHVRIFSDSLQGVCDSISYTQNDSTIRMMYNPIAWSRQSQVTGDTILMYMDSNKLKRIYVPNNALVVSRSGPEIAQMYDQIQGKTLTGNLKNNEITDMVVKPHAECIYYSKDDSGAYLGVNQAESERMRVFFADRKISKILFDQDVHQTLTPIEQADLPNMRLSRFQWHMDRRPHSKEELFK